MTPEPETDLKEDGDQEMNEDEDSELKHILELQHLNNSNGSNGNNAFGALKKHKSLIDVRDDIIELPYNLPKSSIVYGDYGNKFDVEKDKERMRNMDKQKECKRIIGELFDKYVIVGSEMEVNLSHRVRKNCMRKYDRLEEMNDDALFHIFDKCIETLLKLMQDSYLRFKSTPGFDEYEAKLKRKIQRSTSCDL